MQFKLFNSSKEAFQIERKGKRLAIKILKMHDLLCKSSQKYRKIAKKNMPKWQLAIEKNDTIETIINSQKTFNTS